MILQEALTPLPSFAVALIVAVPFCNAFTFPFLSTAATFVLDEYHFTALFVAFDGVTTAFNVRVSPFFIPACVLFNVILWLYPSLLGRIRNFHPLVTCAASAPKNTVPAFQTSARCFIHHILLFTMSLLATNLFAANLFAYVRH